MGVFLELGAEANKRFENEYVELLNYFKEYDPLYLCSFCAYYFTSSEEGIDEEAIKGYLEFPQFYVEILQAFSLMAERTISAKPLHEKVEDFKSLVQNLNQNQSIGYYKLIKNIEQNENGLNEFILRADMMLHTLAVRNWAYVGQMKTINQELAFLISEDFKRVIGFNSSDFIEVFSGLVNLIENKFNAHRNNTRLFIQQKNYNDVFNTYEKSFDSVEKQGEKQREQFREKIVKNLKALKVFLLEHSDLFLSDIFTLNIEEIFNHFEGKYNKVDIEYMLENLSLSFGELSEINKDFVFLDNPIHSKPFIKTEDGYFSSIPHMFDHLGVSLLESLIWTDVKLKNIYLEKKGKYLEEKVELLFKSSFPNARVLSGSKWYCPMDKKDYENDLIVLIEEFAIIVECKSGAISSSAKRGAPDRLFRTMKDLVISPSEQAIRFQNFLKNNPKEHLFTTKSSEVKNKVDSSKIKYFVPLGVTLSHLGNIGCNLKKLIKANVVSNKLEELAPSISYTDLEVIFEILSSQSEKIHYLSRRREFEAHVEFNGDEIDLFAFYLDNGFNIGEVEYNDTTHFDFTLKSKELDPYMIGKHRGVEVKKPILKKTKYWQDLLDKIELRTKNWLINSFILLNLPEQDQKEYERNLKILKKRILDGKVEKKYNYMLMKVGVERRRYTLAGFPYKDIDKVTRNNLINDIIAEGLEDENSRGVLVIGYDLNYNHYPYSVIAGSYESNLFDDLS
ncbi:hypothetical protein [Formosa haliotis]|uniref:hypothetical protein n=1 Tax=Formosa haliotis TaxID=1555194 RepID=UPI000823FF3A|nr:hypothetical protein [Formosa haliotis]